MMAPTGRGLHARFDMVEVCDIVAWTIFEGTAQGSASLLAPMNLGKIGIKLASATIGERLR